MALKVVFFDCDGTLTKVKSSWQYLHERLDLWDRKADEFQRLFLAGKIDYGEFCRRDAALWRGMPASRVLDIMDEIDYQEGVRETMEAIRGEGVFTVILSSGLSFLVEKVSSELGISRAVANELVVEEGVLTGDIRINVEHDGAGNEGRAGRDKGHWVREILADLGLEKGEAAAVGDSEGDRAMFGEVGVAIGYRPAEAVLPFVDRAIRGGSFREVFEVLRERA